MSPRKNNVITVKGWPDPKKGKLYKGVVTAAINKAKFVRVTIEDLDPSQLGRIHNIELPLPIRPSRYHKTCAFLVACGIDSTIDRTSVDLHDVVGTTVGMRFGTASQDGSEQIDFERIGDSPMAQPGSPLEKSENIQPGFSSFQSEKDNKEL